MADKRMKIWYDKEGDFLEANPHVMEKVDDNGNVLGFSVMKVSALRDEPLEVDL